MRVTVKETGIVLLMSFGMLLLNPDAKAQSQNDQDTLQMKNEQNIVTLQLMVKGMSCQAGCANGIDKMLRQQNGILESKTTFDSSTSEVKFDKSKISEKEIAALIEEKGFKTKAIEKK